MKRMLAWAISTVLLGACDAHGSAAIPRLEPTRETVPVVVVEAPRPGHAAPDVARDADDDDCPAAETPMSPEDEALATEVERTLLLRMGGQGPAVIGDDSFAREIDGPLYVLADLPFDVPALTAPRFVRIDGDAEPRLRRLARHRADDTFYIQLEAHPTSPSRDGLRRVHVELSFDVVRSAHPERHYLFGTWTHFCAERRNGVVVTHRGPTVMS